jgi:hypothetical protein
MKPLDSQMSHNLQNLSSTSKIVLVSSWNINSLTVFYKWKLILQVFGTWTTISEGLVTEVWEDQN